MEEIGKILPSIFTKQIQREDPHLVEILASLWPRLAGQPMARHSRPISFGDGTLTLGSDCSSWTEQLRGLTEEIRNEINGFLGRPVVKRLQVRYVPNLCLVQPDADERKMV